MAATDDNTLDGLTRRQFLGRALSLASAPVIAASAGLSAGCDPMDHYDPILENSAVTILMNQDGSKVKITQNYTEYSKDRRRIKAEYKKYFMLVSDKVDDFCDVVPINYRLASYSYKDAGSLIWHNFNVPKYIVHGDELFRQQSEAIGIFRQNMCAIEDYLAKGAATRCKDKPRKKDQSQKPYQSRKLHH